MKLTDLIVEVRDESLARVGQLRPADLPGFNAILRFNAPGTWSCRLPYGHPMAEALRQPGAGIIVSTSQGVLLSGPTRAVKLDQSTEDPVGAYTITGVDDSIILGERLAYPEPSNADVSTQLNAYDVRTGSAEDVMKAYVEANIGPTAPATRQIPELTIEPSLNRGPTVQESARFDTLQELLEGLGQLATLGFTIEQEDADLQFKVYEPADRTKFVRLDIDNGKLNRTEYSYSEPKATRVIVAGQGDGASRTFIERTTSDSLNAETQWRRRIEVFKDQRNSGDTAELEQAGDEILVVDGKTVVSVSVSPSDRDSMLFGIDWNLGDKVTVVVGPTELEAVVSEVGIGVAADGVRIIATVGEPTSLDFETQVLTKQTDQALRISKLERTK